MVNGAPPPQSETSGLGNVQILQSDNEKYLRIIGSAHWDQNFPNDGVPCNKKGETSKKAGTL